MKKYLYLLFTVVVSFAQYAKAQVPQGIPYQAAARGANGQALLNQAVKVKFSIIDSIATGMIVYQETHSLTTNSTGIFNANIGMGTSVSGTFNTINWGKNTKFMQVELDPTGAGSNYLDMGTQQMLSVPYALYAGSANLANNALTVAGNTYLPQTRIGFDASTTWTCPTGVTRIKVELWGGGGAGGNYCYYNGNPVTSGIYVNNGGNGGNGGYNMAYLSVTPGASYQVTIGAGGVVALAKSSLLYQPGFGWTSGITGDLNSINNNADGGTSSFAGLLFASGGTRGISATELHPGDNGMNAPVSNYNYPTQNFGTRNYIPNSYLTPIPQNFALGGNTYIAVGTDALHCSSCNPNNGEPGYCVISY